MMGTNVLAGEQSIQLSKTVNNLIMLDKGKLTMEYNEIGIAALQNGEYEKAVESFMQGVEKDPKMQSVISI